MQQGSSKYPKRAEHKRWEERVVQYAQRHGAFPHGDRYSWQLHHPEGRSAVARVGLERVHVGWWYILPIEFQFHDITSIHPENVTHFRDAFVAAHGEQRTMWDVMCRTIQDDSGPLPFGDEVVQAVMTFRR